MRFSDFQGVLLWQHPFADVLLGHLSPFLLDYTHKPLSLAMCQLTFCPTAYRTMCTPTAWGLRKNCIATWSLCLNSSRMRWMLARVMIGRASLCRHHCELRLSWICGT